MVGVLPVLKDSLFCGLNRKDGLRLKMLYEPGLAYCHVNLDNRFEGYPGLLHGGLIFGILDVAIWYVIFMETRKIAMTRKTEMEFLKPVVCNEHYLAKSQLLKIKGKDIHATAWVEDDQGEVYARVNALFREAKGWAPEQVIANFDFSQADPEIKEFFFSLVG